VKNEWWHSEFLPRSENQTGLPHVTKPSLIALISAKQEAAQSYSNSLSSNRETRDRLPNSGENASKLTPIWLSKVFQRFTALLYIDQFRRSGDKVLEELDLALEESKKAGNV